MTVGTVEQRHSHLQMANRARAAHSEIRAELAAGEISIAVALFDQRAQTLTIARLLTAQPHWGDFRTRTLLSRLEIRELKRVWELTTRQRVAIIESIGAPA